MDKLDSEFPVEEKEKKWKAAVGFHICVNDGEGKVKNPWKRQQLSVV